MVRVYVRGGSCALVVPVLFVCSPHGLPASHLVVEEEVEAPALGPPLAPTVDWLPAPAPVWTSGQRWRAGQGLWTCG